MVGIDATRRVLVLQASTGVCMRIVESEHLHVFSRIRALDSVRGLLWIQGWRETNDDEIQSRFYVLYDMRTTQQFVVDRCFSFFLS